MQKLNFGDAVYLKGKIIGMEVDRDSEKILYKIELPDQYLSKNGYETTHILEENENLVTSVAILNK